LGILNEHGYDTTKSVEFMNKNNMCRSSTPFAINWEMRDIRLFEIGMAQNFKDFNKIHKLMELHGSSKKKKDVIDFYYLWKKSDFRKDWEKKKNYDLLESLENLSEDRVLESPPSTPNDSDSEVMEEEEVFSKKRKREDDFEDKCKKKKKLYHFNENDMGSIDLFFPNTFSLELDNNFPIMEVENNSYNCIPVDQNYHDYNNNSWLGHQELDWNVGVSEYDFLN